MSQTVAGTLVDVLEKVGVRQIFGLIGDSLNAIADAVRHSKIEWIGVRHEEGAALADLVATSGTRRRKPSPSPRFTSPRECPVRWALAQETQPVLWLKSKTAARVVVVHVVAVAVAGD